MASIVFCRIYSELISDAWPLKSWRYSILRYRVCVNNEAQIFSEKILEISGLTKVPIEFIREISDETNQ